MDRLQAGLFVLVNLHYRRDWDPDASSKIAAAGAVFVYGLITWKTVADTAGWDGPGRAACACAVSMAGMRAGAFLNDHRFGNLT